MSEPPEIRRQIEQQARAELIKAGADDKATTVTVLSAYKQGYSWLYDVVRPALEGKAVDQLTIKFAEIGPPAGWKQQGMYAPTRWLLEIYPIDEILASELKIDLKNIHFEMAPIGSPAYEVIATAKDGASLFRRTFDPAIVERPFFDRFPDYEHVRVTTGWIKASVGGRTAVDERIATDPERFWDRFQSKTLPALYDHVMALGNGKPRPEDAPFFGELTVDLTLSEPEYRLPVDEEQISSMEALHEEIYFNTIHFFDVMGRFTRGAGLAYPGRIIPVMHPKADGKPGRAKISVTGFDASRPSVVVEYTERNGRSGVARLDIPKIAVDRPQTLAATVRAGRDGIERLDLRVKVDTEKDERDALIKRSDEFRVDRTMLSAEQATAVFANLNRLRAAGAYRDALAYHDLGAVRVTVGWEHESKPGTEVVATLEPNGAPAPFPDIKKLLPRGLRRGCGDHRRSSNGTRRFRRPRRTRSSRRCRRSRKRPSTRSGESYLGKDVWAMDLMPPIEASHWSQAKQTTMKPTIVYSARQHANEVSSTSHVLRMAELLLTDPVYREKLNKVNVVIHPITNADGAQLAYDLQKINPTYMLHAGYLGSLGVDVTVGAVGPRSDLSGERHPAEDLAHLAARHLPQPARLPVARVGADLLGVRRLGAHALGRDARLLDDARLVDARVRLAGRCAVSAAQGRADEAARDDHRVREAGAGHRRAQRAGLRSLQALQLRFRSEELQARFHERRADLQVDQGRARQPAEPGLHDAQAERDDLGRRHRGARRDRARRLDEAGRQRRPAVGQGDPRLPGAGPPRGRAQGRAVLERRQPVDEPAAAAEAGEGRGREENDGAGRAGQVGRMGRSVSRPSTADEVRCDLQHVLLTVGYSS